MYLAPEILQGGPHTYMTDLWSLGCVFYEMYTGHPPFLAEDFSALVDKVVHKDLPTPKVKGSRVSAKPSPHFDSMLQGLFKKSPEKRYVFFKLNVINVCFCKILLRVTFFWRLI